MERLLLVVIKIVFVFIIIWSLPGVCGVEDDVTLDPNGYIAFCPCMGRFGNQADHYLGVLGFAHGLNRTLILPPWVEYKPGVLKSIQVPFDTYFRVDPLKKFTKVVTMEEFMENLAPEIWPPEKRIAFCYVARHNSNGCEAKQGNPFGSFWDTFDVDFVGSELYGPLTYDVHHRDMGTKWNEKYPPSQWPVLAFTGAPASFPVQKENRFLQKYLVWNDNIVSLAKQELSKLPRGPVIGIHLRNGVDWVRACDHVSQSPLLFAAPQCLGYRGEHGAATLELCLPPKDLILKQLKRVIKTSSARSVFVASDADHMIEFLSEGLRKMQVSVHKMDEPEPHVELAVLARTNHFIGNCVSSFSAFVKRERDTHGFPSTFWAFPLSPKPKHIEL